MAGSDNVQRKWVLKPQETEGTYMFSGKMYVTAAVADNISLEEITQMVNDLKAFVKANKGADYLQVFKEVNGHRVVYIIDSLNQEMIKDSTPEFVKEHDLFTILFPYER